MSNDHRAAVLESEPPIAPASPTFRLVVRRGTAPEAPSAGVFAAANAAIEEGRLLLALEMLDSASAVAESPRQAEALRATTRVAVGHLTHARLAAPTSRVTALAAGDVAAVVTAPELVETLEAPIRAGERWAADELAAIAEASARTDQRRSWHAAERLARTLVADATSHTRGALTWILASAAHRRGDAAGAAAMLVALPGGDPARLPEIAVIAVAAEDEGLGRRALAAAEVLRERNPGVLILSALAQNVAAILNGDVDALRHSASLLAETRRPLLHGAAAERAGMLHDALAVYGGCGATHDADRVRRAITASGAPPVAPLPNWGELTVAELRVVRVVAAGATNRRAAQQLFLSPHTVSSHLRHAFEKLGIRSRVELARLYAHQESFLPGLAG